MPLYCKTPACTRKKKHASYGLKSLRKKEWCGPCAKRHGGIYLGKRKMCEDCHKKSAHYGLQGNTKRRWCGPCAKRHGGVVYLGTRKMCEDLAAGQPVWHGDAIGRNTKGRRKQLTRRKGKRK